MIKINRENILRSSAWLIFTIVFFKNAWVTEDAYINFRSIEQLFAGNGPNWNPYERVQVYTSPLWYFLLAIMRIFSQDNYLNSILLSFAANIFLLIFIQANFSALRFFVFTILILSCQSISDYLTGGLENSLTFALVGIVFLGYSGKLSNKLSCFAAALMVTLWLKFVLGAF